MNKTKVLLSLLTVCFFLFVVVVNAQTAKSVTSKEEDFDDFKIKDIGLTMIKCPAGSFIMGSSDEDSLENINRINATEFHIRTWGFYYHEQPHWVTISKPFYIGKYEVTQGQYEAIMGINPSTDKDARKPVESVSWGDARLFCEKLNEKYATILPAGYKFDLPTEAQWEFACRAGTDTHLNNGQNITNLLTSNGFCSRLDKVGWFVANSSDTIHIVGQKKPNSWDIYDMHGNVAEWCRDWYSEYPVSELVDPYVDAVGRIPWRVQRGGGFFSNAWECSSSARGFGSLTTANPFVGFRVVLEKE